MKFCDKIIKLRKRYGYTQETFAGEVGVSRQSVYKWENGSSYPEVEKLLKIARTLSITVDDLLNEEMGLNENGEAVPMTDEEAALVKVKRVKKPTRAPRKVKEGAEAVAEEAAEEAAEETVEAPAEEVIETVEAPAAEEETPVEAPVEAPVEVPVEAPVETPVETPVEAPVEEKKEEKKRGGLFGWFRRK